jgi:hypothetical protein
VAKSLLVGQKDLVRHFNYFFFPSRKKFFQYFINIFIGNKKRL